MFQFFEITISRYPTNCHQVNKPLFMHLSVGNVLATENMM